MQAKTILFPTDFSTASDAALEYASALARDTGAILLIVHVQEPQEYYSGELYYGVPLPPNPEVRRMLDAVVPTDSQIRYEHRLELGDVASTIVQLAKAEGADLIVMGTHGRTGLGRVVMGSVAEKVVRKAHCPVLTLRQTATKPATKIAPATI